MKPAVPAPSPSRPLRPRPDGHAARARTRTAHNSPVQLHLRDLLARIAAQSPTRHGREHHPATRAILDGDRAACFSLECAWRDLVRRFETREASDLVRLIPEYIALDITATQDDEFGPVDEDDDLEAVLVFETEREGDANEASLRALAHPSSVGEMQHALDRLLLHRAAIERATAVLARRIQRATRGAAA